MKRETLSNINILLNWRNDAIKFVEDYGSVILDIKRKATKGKWLNQQHLHKGKQVITQKIC